MSFFTKKKTTAELKEELLDLRKQRDEYRERKSLEKERAYIRAEVSGKKAFKEKLGKVADTLTKAGNNLAKNARKADEKAAPKKTYDPFTDGSYSFGNTNKKKRRESLF